MAPFSALLPFHFSFVIFMLVTPLTSSHAVLLFTILQALFALNMELVRDLMVSLEQDLVRSALTN